MHHVIIPGVMYRGMIEMPEIVGIDGLGSHIITVSIDQHVEARGEPER
jgi:hypothetical protein